MFARSESDLKEKVVKAAKELANCPLPLMAEASEKLFQAVEDLERFERDHKKAIDFDDDD